MHDMDRVPSAPVLTPEGQDTTEEIPLVVVFQGEKVPRTRDEVAMVLAAQACNNRDGTYQPALF